MEAPQVVHELKRDVFGRVELLGGPQGPAIRRVACGNGVPGTRLVARTLLGRERRALVRLERLDGVPHVLERASYAGVVSADGRSPRRGDVLVRSYLDGVPLWAAESLPLDFFERLEDLVRELHGLGVCHNDLHKEPNVLVRPDGSPAVLDFQLASVHDESGRRFEARVREDLRHVRKHHRRYERRGRTEAVVVDGGGDERARTAALWMRYGKPLYNLVTRRLLRQRGSEPRRASTGPWPEWTAALGPSTRTSGRD